MDAKKKKIIGTVLILFPAVVLATYPLWGEELVAFLAGLLPPCGFYQTTHLMCPGCGNTRSILALSHGDLLDAARYNIMPFVLGGIVALLYVEQILSCFGRPVKIVPRGNWFLYGTITLMLSFYVIRNFIPALQV